MEQRESVGLKRARREFIDIYVLVAVLILAAIGVLMVFSITGTSIHNNQAGDRMSYVNHSINGVIGGVVLMAFMTFFPNKLYRGNLGKLILIGTLVIFIITPIFGESTIAAPDIHRWLVIPVIDLRFQAVDLARIGFTLSLPWLIQYLIDRGQYFSDQVFAHYLIALGYVGICTFLILLQPDLGSAMVIFLTGGIVFIASGLHKIQLTILLSIVGTVLAVVLILGFDNLGFLFARQGQRINIWLDPFNHDYGLQSIVGFTSIALGGMWGVGLGNSTQALGFAIEPHTDLIVTILAEELGFVAVMVVMVLYFLIAFRCFTTALKSRDTFKALICIGIGAFFLTQPLVNLGGSSGIIPLSGVVLPLISYGMTSKFSTFILIGIYFNVRRSILVEVEKYKILKHEERLYQNKTVNSNILEFPKNRNS